jgi:hypothetical protein
MMLTTEIQKVGINSDSVGCVTQLFMVFGNMVNRAIRAEQKDRKRTMSRMHTISPITWRPWNR